MRVKFTSYSYDLEAYDGQAAYYGASAVRAFDDYGEVQGYVREDGMTYAVILTDRGTLVDTSIDNLEVVQ